MAFPADGDPFGQRIKLLLLALDPHSQRIEDAGGLAAEPVPVGLDRLKIQLETEFLGFNGLECAAVVLDVEPVFDEKGRQAQDLVPGIEHGPKQGVQAARGAAGNDDVLGADRLAAWQ